MLQMVKSTMPRAFLAERTALVKPEVHLRSRKRGWVVEDQCQWDPGGRMPRTGIS